jgi:O-antigen/teichoic acid export membrane protein
MRYVVLGRFMLLPLLNLILVAVLFLMSFRLNAVVVGHIISVSLTAAVSIFFLTKAFPEIMQVPAIPETRKLLRFSIPLLLVAFITFIIQWTDTLMIGYFMPSGRLGIYSVAMKTSQLTSIVLACFVTIFRPVVSTLSYQKERHKLQTLLSTVTRWAYIASFSIFLLIVLLSKDVLSLFGPEFAAGRHSLIILSFAQLINASVGPVGATLVMSGKQDYLMYNTLIVCLSNILMNYILIPSHGILGAAIASGTSIIVLNIAMLIEAIIILKVHPFSLHFYKLTLSGLITFGAVYLLKNTGFEWSGLIGIVLYTLVFLIILILMICMWGFDNDDKYIFNLFKLNLFKMKSKRTFFKIEKES